MQISQKFKVGEIVECIQPLGDLVSNRKYKVYSINDEDDANSLIDVQDLVTTKLVGGWYASRFIRAKKTVRKIV